MSNSGTEYLLGSFRFSSASGSGHQDNTIIGWGSYGVLAHIIHDGSSRNGGVARASARSGTRVTCEPCPCLSRFSRLSRPSRLSQVSAIAAEAFMNNAGLGYLRGRRLYEGFRQGTINQSVLVPIMG